MKNYCTKFLFKNIEDAKKFETQVNDIVKVMNVLLNQDSETNEVSVNVITNGNTDSTLIKQISELATSYNGDFISSKEQSQVPFKFDNELYYHFESSEEKKCFLETIKSVIGVFYVGELPSDLDIIHVTVDKRFGLLVPNILNIIKETAIKYNGDRVDNPNEKDSDKPKVNTLVNSNNKKI